MAIVVCGKFQYMMIIINVLYLTESVITRIEHKDGYKKSLYKVLYKRRTRYKQICSNIQNDIKYFMKQCLTFRRLQFAHVLNFN